MSDKQDAKTTLPPRRLRPPRRDDDFARRMARAELGRHYVDGDRIEQVLEGGEAVFRHRKDRD